MDEFCVSTERARMDLALIHQFLSQQSYWKKGVSLDVVRKSIEHSLCFGGFVGERQVAFARVITDYTGFAYLCDVFVLPEHRGKGYSKRLMRAMLDHPELQTINWMLKTDDAGWLYSQFGFTPVDDGAKYMRRSAPVRWAYPPYNAPKPAKPGTDPD
jgi:GNAT superfamily N-acetyltransferase